MDFIIDDENENESGRAPARAAAALAAAGEARTAQRSGDTTPPPATVCDRSGLVVAAGIEQLGAELEVHRVVVHPAPAPDEALTLERVNDLFRNLVPE